MFYNKYLVIGGNSLVGSELYNKLLNLKKNVKITTRRKNHKNRDLHFDLISPNDLDIHNSIVYFCAAETNISKCEKEPIISNKINYINTVQTIKNLLNKNCKIIYLSTQAVFSGQKNLCKENDNKDPTCNYGIQKNKVEITQEFSSIWNQIIVLKGSNTIISHPNGNLLISPWSNSGLSKAGSGDLLTGIISGLSAHTQLNSFDSASLGVYLHGLSGYLATNNKGVYGMTSTDILEKIPEAFTEILLN